MIENSFGVLKKSFKELLLETNLHILFIPNMVVCCCILYNMILGGKDIDPETLMIQLELENKANVDNVLNKKEGNGRIFVGHWEVEVEP